jgi:hypothetical protein
MKTMHKCIVVVLMLVAFAAAANRPAPANLKPAYISTGDEIILTHGHPYLGGSRSPGDSIGTTGLEYQANGGCEKRIYVDDSFQVHVVWMKVPFPFSSMAQRRMEWSFRYTDGSYFGELDASPFTSGYGSLDLTQDAAVADQRSIISYHFNTGTNAYYPFYDVDAGNGLGSLPNDPKNPPNTNNMLWPMVAESKNGNFILATDDNAGNFHHVYVTTDNGTTWTNPINYDSAACISIFVVASRVSNKVAFVETRFKTDSAAAGQIDDNVWYTLSTDGGVTWGTKVNLTNYQSSDSMRAYCNVSALWDNNDNLHIVWAARYIYQGGYYDASKIMHWDQVHNQISVVSKTTGQFAGGWWGWNNANGYGAWRLPADEPLMTVDRTTGELYTTWCGQDDINDVSLGGYPNGDIYGARSVDGGLTWGDWVNLTNTHTPGAGTGACEDEDYIAVCPYVVRDSIFITYIEDKDAGAITQTEGDTTDNPARVLVVHKSKYVGIEEQTGQKPVKFALSVRPNPVSDRVSLTYTMPEAGNVVVRVFGTDGRQIAIMNQGIQPAGTHNAAVDTRLFANGTYFVRVETPTTSGSRSIVVIH